MAFLPATSLVGSPDAPRLGFVLHGALGSAQNWRGFSRRLADALPNWGFVLVDLRHHGGSRPAPPPSTLSACVADLDRLAARLGRRVDAVIGHSLGGKVALAALRDGRDPPAQAWALDSLLGAEPEAQWRQREVVRVLTVVRELAPPFAKREDAVAALMARGFVAGFARWLAASLARGADGSYSWALEVDGIEELLADYFRQDFWPFLAETRTRSEVHVVVAAESHERSPELRQRLDVLPPAAQVTSHLLADAGHWLHVDNPDGLLALMVPALGALDPAPRL